MGEEVGVGDPLGLCVWGRSRGVGVGGERVAEDESKEGDKQEKPQNLDKKEGDGTERGRLVPVTIEEVGLAFYRVNKKAKPTSVVGAEQVDEVVQAEEGEGERGP